MAHPTIGFVGFGEAAQCFGRHLAQRQVGEILTFCDGGSNHPPYTQAFRARVADCGARPVGSLDELTAACDVVFSAVVVANCVRVGEQIAAKIRPGTLVVDINASTPAAKRAVSRWVNARQGSYVDANLMGAVSIYGASVPLYSSGDGGARFADTFGPLGFSIELAGSEPGAAAAVKMLRSVVTKGIEALVVEALTAAALSGVGKEAWRAICAPMDATTFSRFVDMCIRTDVLHAGRRAVEMDGVAEAIRDLGLAPIMASATAERLRRSAALDARAELGSDADYTADDVLAVYARKSASG
jgi:3-hydroxyisobutyrate dehydrogenase-like beta-hydroxyacid dehydrogenase